MDFLQHWAVVWLKLSGSNSNTNLLASKPIKREKASLPVDVCRSKTPLLKLPNHGRLLRHLGEEDDGKGERGEKEETRLHAHALPSFYILKISTKLKKITSYADFLRRSPKNVCVGGYKRDYFGRSKPGCHGLLRVLDSDSLLAEACFLCCSEPLLAGKTVGTMP